MVRAGIAGATGYTGLELVQWIQRHPVLTIGWLTSESSAGKTFSDVHAAPWAIPLITLADAYERASDVDVVFLCLPHGESIEAARRFAVAGLRVIDLSADFRLETADAYRKWYSAEHSAPELLSEFVYGLCEVNREQLRGARLIANPGCYPTSVKLGLMPVLEPSDAHADPLIDSLSIIADCKSGVSGAGRKAEVHTLLAEASDNFKAYGVSGHRHWPEIRQGLSAIAGRPVNLVFTPHLVPMIRGIHSTLYARLTPAGLATDLQALYEARFASEPFVDVMPAGSTPDTRSVRASNMARIAIHRPPDSDLLMVLVVEDNLVKGASGQAVQAMNLMFGLPEEMGLTQIPILP